ncbi:MAG: tRNA pseudouridine(55) synthase TruB [Spirochaetia bacterium]
MNSSRKIPSSGIALIDKPEGVTSFQSLSAIKKRVGHGKVGHAGTLDKFASGLLLVLIGPYTKLNSYLTGLDKSYEGTVHFGETTTTLDPEGEVIEEKPVPQYDTIRDSMALFTGTIDQVPPKFSAVHIEGRRAYRRALSGEEVNIPSRSVTIHSFEPRDWEPPELHFSVSCSKGTYIRSLARDLGIHCESSAYLSNLRRTHIGPFDVKDAVSPELFDPAEHLLSDETVLEAIPGFSVVRLKELYLDKVKNGKEIQKEWLEDAKGLESGYAAILDDSGTLAAVTEIRDNRFFYKFVVPGQRK